IRVDHREHPPSLTSSPGYLPVDTNDSGSAARSFHDISQIVDEPGGHLPQPFKYTRLSDQRCIWRQTQLLSNHSGWLPILDLAFEGAPRRRLELQADRFQERARDVLVVLLIPRDAQCAGRISKFFQGTCWGYPGSCGAALPVSTEPIDGNPPQPGA